MPKQFRTDFLLVSADVVRYTRQYSAPELTQSERIAMLARYLMNAGLLSLHELDAAQTLVRSSRARGAPLALADALVQLGIITAPTLMALTFVQQLDRAEAAPTRETLQRYLVQSGLLTADELTRAQAAQTHAQAEGKQLSLGAALVRACNLSLRLLDERAKRAATPAAPPVASAKQPE